LFVPEVEQLTIHTLRKGHASQIPAMADVVSARRAPLASLSCAVEKPKQLAMIP
jgi:hypothetical protein